VLAAVIAAAMLVSISLFGTPLMRTIVAGPMNVAAVLSAVLVDMANADRAALGLGTLMPDPLLTAAAQAKANDMAQKSYFAHFDAAGKSPWDWMHEVGYQYQHAGENLAIQFSESGDVQRAWLASPAHRANLLDGKFTQVGIATAEGFYQGQPTTFVVQFFGTPPDIVAPAPVVAALEPEPIAVPPDAQAAPAPAPEEPLAQKETVAVLGVSETESSSEQKEEPVAEPVNASVSLEGSTTPFIASLTPENTPPLAPARVRFAASAGEPLRAFAGSLAVVLAFTLLFVAFREWEARHRRHVFFAVSLSTACALGFIVIETALMQTPATPPLFSSLQASSADTSVALSPEFGLASAPYSERVSFAPLAFVEKSTSEVQLASAGASEIPTSTLALVTLLSACALFLLVVPRVRKRA
jgi:uncharacterized protein YkwD